MLTIFRLVRRTREWSRLHASYSGIEIFYPKEYAHDYQRTSTALGMKYYGVWNDTYFSLPQQEPSVAYPHGFQSDYIPVHGPTVAKLIEDTVDEQDLLARINKYLF